MLRTEIAAVLQSKLARSRGEWGNIAAQDVDCVEGWEGARDGLASCLTTSTTTVVTTPHSTAAHPAATSTSVLYLASLAFSSFALAFALLSGSSPRRHCPRRPGGSGPSSSIELVSPPSPSLSTSDMMTVRASDTAVRGRAHLPRRTVPVVMPTRRRSLNAGSQLFSLYIYVTNSLVNARGHKMCD